MYTNTNVVYAVFFLFSFSFQRLGIGRLCHLNLNNISHNTPKIRISFLNGVEPPLFRSLPITFAFIITLVTTDSKQNPSTHILLLEHLLSFHTYFSCSYLCQTSIYVKQKYLNSGHIFLLPLLLLSGILSCNFSEFINTLF